MFVFLTRGFYLLIISLQKREKFTQKCLDKATCINLFLI